MKIYLASGNLNKKREMSEIFPEHTIVVPKDEGIDFDPDETGTTFYENSIIKAKALYDIVGCPVLADDSGICVDVLGGAPGIYSSRYAGPDFMQGRPDGKKIPQEEQNRLLIEQMNRALEICPEPEKNSAKGLFPNGPRSARYVCAMVFYRGPSQIYVCQDTMEGTIIERVEDQRGENGFGYDPLFFLPQYGKTSAEISPEEKNAISHRGKAARAIKKLVDSLSD
ncbi:MAG: non-canonical purine NTP pyrophosphatase [Treponema sp.]|nr:non-canonical purine NTP pyrophosphatase [Treponema sp.]